MWLQISSYNLDDVCRRNWRLHLLNAYFVFALSKRYQLVLRSAEEADLFECDVSPCMVLPPHLAELHAIDSTSA